MFCAWSPLGLAPNRKPRVSPASEWKSLPSECRGNSRRHSSLRSVSLREPRLHCHGGELQRHGPLALIALRKQKSGPRPAFIAAEGAAIGTRPPQPAASPTTSPGARVLRPVRVQTRAPSRAATSSASRSDQSDRQPTAYLARVYSCLSGIAISTTFMLAPKPPRDVALPVGSLTLYNVLLPSAADNTASA